MTKFAILIGLFTFIAQGDYYIIETKLLFFTTLFYEKLKQKIVIVSKENLLEFLTEDNANTSITLL